jgi:glycyl-tRNA synthetase beta chain
VEKELLDAARRTHGEIDAAVARVDYPAAVSSFLKLKDPIDRFFEGVMVMSEDAAERRRRLAILSEVKSLFDRLYDLTRIVVEG